MDQSFESFYKCKVTAVTAGWDDEVNDPPTLINMITDSLAEYVTITLHTSRVRRETHIGGMD